MELVMYIRDKRFRDIVEEKLEVIYDDKSTEWVDKSVNRTSDKKVDRKRLWVRLGRARPIGLLVSNEKGVGWSLVHDPDQFNRDEAFRIARNRIDNPVDEFVPYKIRKLILIMNEKNSKAFKK